MPAQHHDLASHGCNDSRRRHDNLPQLSTGFRQYGRRDQTFALRCRRGCCVTIWRIRGMRKCWLDGVTRTPGTSTCMGPQNRGGIRSREKNPVSGRIDCRNVQLCTTRKNSRHQPDCDGNERFASYRKLQHVATLGIHSSLSAIQLNRASIDAQPQEFRSCQTVACVLATCRVFSTCSGEKKRQLDSQSSDPADYDAALKIVVLELVPINRLRDIYFSQGQHFTTKILLTCCRIENDDVIGG